MEDIEARLRRDLRRSTLVYLAFPNDDDDIETLSEGGGKLASKNQCPS